MKPLLKEPVWNAVKGLWLSGVYGTCAGSLAGIVCGASVGVMVLLYLLLAPFPPEAIRSGLDTLLFFLFFAMLYGGAIGGVVGAYVGFPAGVLGGGLGGRRGCAAGTALAAFAVGSGILALLFRQVPPEYRDSDLRIPFLLLFTFTIVSYAIGSYLYRLLDSELAFFPKWRFVLQHCGIRELSKNDRAVSIAVAIAPVALAYGGWLLAALKEYPRGVL